MDAEEIKYRNISLYSTVVDSLSPPLSVVENVVSPYYHCNGQVLQCGSGRLF